MAEKGRGAALLTVLLLVAVMAVIAAIMLDRLNLATRMAANSSAMTQARLYAISAENILATRLGALIAADRNRTVDRLGLLDRESILPLSRGTVRATISDRGNCFNLNSVVTGLPGDYRVDAAKLAQFRRLSQMLGMEPAQAAAIGDALVDWIDSDLVPRPNGAEDGEYLARPEPYRTSARLFSDESELRALHGMDEAAYRLLRPWVCAIPSNLPVTVNLNTLRPDQAILVAAMLPGAAGTEQVRQLLLARPATGWPNVAQATAPLARQGLLFGPEQFRQLGVASRWFEARLVVRVDSVRLEERALIDARVQPAAVVNRNWGEID